MQPKTAVAVIALAAALVPALAPAAALADWNDQHPRMEHEIVARVAWFRPYNLQLEDGMHVFLHDGTVINPRGVTLHHGMVVRIVGHRTDGGAYSADEIDLIPR